MSKDIDINELTNSIAIISNMVTKSQVNHILNHLKKTLDNNIIGDVVELGCNVGTTSIFIRTLLNLSSSNKDFHIYDSFEGLPPKLSEDFSIHGKKYKKGTCKTSLETFTNNFKEYNLKLPIINKGWFSEILDDKYPDQISFAFFDGDFYSSIIDSFNKVYHKLSPGAIVIIHDYAWDKLPGVQKACDDFLKDKEENMEILEIGVGLMVKK